MAFDPSRKTLDHMRKSMGFVRAVGERVVNALFLLFLLSLVPGLNRMSSFVYSSLGGQGLVTWREFLSMTIGAIIGLVLFGVIHGVIEGLITHR